VIHIGEIIHQLVKEKHLTAKEVAEYMNFTTSNLFAIYKKDEIDIFKLARFSELFNKNLLQYYISKEAMKVIFQEEFASYESELAELRSSNLSKDEKIIMLNDTVAALKTTVALYEKQGSKGKK